METTTNMIVQNGQTLLLGGILFQEDRTVERKLPLFGDAPLVGGLFRHNQVNLANSEMFVFMTPRVIEEPNATLAEATKSREKLNEIRRGLNRSMGGLKEPSQTNQSDDAAERETEESQEQSGQSPVQIQVDELTKKPQALLNDQPNIAEPRADDSKDPKVHSFSASRPLINRGQSSTLSWSVSNAKYVRIEPGVGPVGLLGSKAVYPSQTTAYTIIATSKTGESRVTQQIEVAPDNQGIVACKAQK